MNIFDALPERQVRLLRWALLGGWLLLILSLLISPWYSLELHRWAGGMVPCAPGPSCELHDHDGTRIFWGLVVPAGLLVIVALSHEVWRRTCPLAFVSQLFRALGWQRTQLGKTGRREVVKVSPDSWLGRHHIELQWSLLIAGLVLRLLVVNSSPLGLGVLLLLTIGASLVVGWAYGGKAWCQYVCPMAPVQAILIGPRSLLGSSAHLGGKSKMTQSMCRSVGELGKEASACVACQTPCIDIDSERLYWQTLRGKRGLDWAWYSYPGLILAFFLLIQWQGDGDINYLRSGRWAYDNGLAERVLTPLGRFSRTVTEPIVQPLQKLAPKAPVLPSPKRVYSPPPLPPKSGNWRPPPLPAEKEVQPEKSDSPDDNRGQWLDHMPPDYIGGSRKPGSAF
jgi:hypothetical protein